MLISLISHGILSWDMITIPSIFYFLFFVYKFTIYCSKNHVVLPLKWPYLTWYVVIPPVLLEVVIMTLHTIVSVFIFKILSLVFLFIIWLAQCYNWRLSARSSEDVFLLLYTRAVQILKGMLHFNKNWTKSVSQMPLTKNFQAVWSSLSKKIALNLCFDIENNIAWVKQN